VRSVDSMRPSANVEARSTTHVASRAHGAAVGARVPPFGWHRDAPENATTAKTHC
jgi:hypothetical protein